MVFKTIIDHPWYLIWLVFCFALWYAWHDHRELLERIKKSTGKDKFWARSRLFLIWFMPALAALAAIAAQVGSDNADTKIDRLTTSLGDESNKLTQAQKQINTQSNALKAAKILPYKERLIDCLNAIDQRIIPALINGTTSFKGEIESSRFADLERLASEPEASQYISLHKEGGYAVKSDGSTVRHANFQLNPLLIQ